MTRYWGNWTATSQSGARYRAGIDYHQSGASVVVEKYIFESAYSIYKDVRLKRGGSLSGTYTVYVGTSGGGVSL